MGSLSSPRFGSPNVEVVISSDSDAADQPGGFHRAYNSGSDAERALGLTVLALLWLAGGEMAHCGCLCSVCEMYDYERIKVYCAWQIWPVTPWRLFD